MSEPNLQKINKPIDSSNLLKEEYKIKILLSFASYLHSNAIDIFNETIFKFFLSLTY